MRTPSLTLRLMGFLLLTQFVAAFGAWFVVAFLAAASPIDFNEVMISYTYNRIRDLIVMSIDKKPDGSLRLDPADVLRARATQNSDLQVAAMTANDRKILPGSSPELRAKLFASMESNTRHMRFSFADQSDKSLGGMIELVDSPHGPIYVAARGFEFRWPDLYFFVIEDRLFNSVVFFVGWGLSVVVIWFGVNGGLAPLRRVVKEVEQIDVESLGQGVDAEGIPREIRPVIAALNRALARVNDSVARMKRFTANAAHELRTPVAIMRARLENTEQSTFRNELMRDASRIQAIVEQLLISARLSEDEVSGDQAVDLTDVVCQVVADYSPLARRIDLGIAFESPDEAIFIYGNQRAIESVLANLIDNALRAEPAGGTVVVRVEDNAIIQVIDHGEGVPPGDREKIFEPFWRGSEAKPGAGLGLSITRELVDKLKARIWVEETPGGGATFKVQLIKRGTVDVAQCCIRPGQAFGVSK
jgi:signal transduction histidine kinase